MFRRERKQKYVSTRHEIREEEERRREWEKVEEEARREKIV